MKNANARSKFALRVPRLNGPLLLGALVVAIVLWAAIEGPALAPKDPLERASPLRVDGEYLRLPYPPGSPGFPLGTDNDGRDLLSRILWGLRPTLSMVLIVAAVRLVLGTLIGLTAGWSDNQPGRVSNALIRVSLAIPVIMVALGGIAAVGVEFGIWAFVFGLSLTGWVETARMVRERTAAIRKQAYIEASHSLGAGDLQILFRHVLRQVMSMLAMLFAFEISSTLMLTAALGFLGYYIGGDVWVQVTDAVAEATAGIPELGQMLATTETIVTRPWPLLMIGGVVFTIVLGFNLLGEGLRRRASFADPLRRGALSTAVQSAALWIEDRVLWPASVAVRSRWFRALVGTSLVLFFTSVGWNYYQDLIATPDTSGITQQEGPLWAGPLGDSAGSRRLQAAGPADGQITWTRQDPEGFSGGPVVTENGLVIAAGTSGVLYAFEPDGTLRWQTRLDIMPVTGPGLDTDGRIFLADETGGLSAYSPVGAFLWRVNSELGQRATSSPIAAPDGTIYYATGPQLHAVRPDGVIAWQANRLTLERAPIQVVEDVAFYGQAVIDLNSGEALRWLPPEQVEQFFSGTDGQLFYTKDSIIYPFTKNGGEIEVQQPLEWQHERFVTSDPQAAGALPDSRYWLFYSGFARNFGFGEDTRVIWLDDSGKVLGNVHYGTRNSAPIGLDQDDTLYSCGNLERGYGPMECQAFGINRDSPLWTLPVDGFEMSGAALAPGRLYVTTSDGFLHAIGEAEVAALPSQPPAPAPSVTRTPEIETPESVPAYTVSANLILADDTGFPAGPAKARDGSVVALSRAGNLYRLQTDGEILWQRALPDRGVGAPVISGDTILALDRLGLTTFSLDGDLLWRFEHSEGAAIKGPVIGPDGRIYYTLQTVQGGNIQALEEDGTELWVTHVQTFAFYRPPQVSPNGELVLFDAEIFSAEDGSAIDLQLDFEPDLFVVGEDRQLYLLFESTFVRWTLTEGRAELAEERVYPPHELGTPTLAGVFEDGAAWFLYRGALAWFKPDGIPEHVAQVEDGFFSHMIGFNLDGVGIACGRDRGDFRQNAVASCSGFSLDSRSPIWSQKLSKDLVEIAGGFPVSDGAVVALENGEMYFIAYQPEVTE